MITIAQNSIADLRPIHCSRVVGEVFNEIIFLSINHNPFIESDAISEVDNLAHNHTEFNMLTTSSAVFEQLIEY